MNLGRKTRNGTSLLPALALGAVVLVSFALGIVSGKDLGKENPIPPAPHHADNKSPAPPLALCLPCKVLAVHDGDTATDVELRVRVQVRYLKCWAPELREPGGAESRDSAKQAEGKTGRLYVPLGEANNLAQLFTFGRVVGELWLDGSAESESERQVRLKHASTCKGGRLGE